jgi:cadmium resistance protein CadD (predicted permease)
LIEVLVTTIFDNNQQAARAKRIDRYCRVIIPLVFIAASILIFVHARG